MATVKWELELKEREWRKEEPTFDGDFFALEIMQITEKNLLPVTTVTDKSQVWEGPFWRANFLFHFGQ